MAGVSHGRIGSLRPNRSLRGRGPDGAPTLTPLRSRPNARSGATGGS